MAAVLLAAVLAADALGATRDVAADDIDDARARGGAGVASRLDALATWCNELRLLGFRDRVLRQLLVFAPENLRARSLLKYSRVKGGGWVQSPDYREPADWNRGLLPHAEKRFAEALAPYRDAVLGAISAHPELPSARREEAVERLVDMLPNDVQLRKSRGDVEREGQSGQWVLPETVEGEKTRATRRKQVEAHEPRARADVGDDRDALALGWKAAVRSRHRRVQGSVDREEVADALVAMDVADALCRDVLGGESPAKGPAVTIIVGTREEARRIVEQDPLDTESKSIFDEVGGLPLRVGPYLSYYGTEEFRRLGGVRNVVAGHLRTHFHGRDRGWLSEGVGQRIVWYVAAAHGPWFVNVAGADRGGARDDEEGDAVDYEAGWIPAAAAVLERDGPPRLATLLTKRLNAMHEPDVAVAYALGAFLLEGRPESFAKFARATMEGDDAEAMVEQALGADVAALSWRLRRWCIEYR